MSSTTQRKSCSVHKIIWEEGFSSVRLVTQLEQNSGDLVYLPALSSVTCALLPFARTLFVHKLQCLDVGVGQLEWHPIIFNTTAPWLHMAQQMWCGWLLRDLAKGEVKRKGWKTRSHRKWQACCPSITIFWQREGGRQKAFLTIQRCQISVGEDDDIIKHFPCVFFITPILFSFQVLWKENRSPMSQPGVLRPLPRGVTAA